MSGKKSWRKVINRHIYYKKPINQIQKNHNKEALSLLEIKKSQTTLEIQAAGTGFVLQHKLKRNFLNYYGQFVKKNKRPTKPQPYR